MVKSRKRKSKMSKKRLEAVKKIERPKEKNRVSHQPAGRGGPLSRPTDYAASPIDIHNARLLGLSVSDDTTDGQLERQLAEFKLAKAYVSDVFIKVAGREYGETEIDELHFNRFVANLLTDGRLATRIAKAQEKRVAKNSGKVVKDGTYRAVKGQLYARFPDALPEQTFLSKILG